MTLLTQTKLRLRRYVTAETLECRTLSNKNQELLLSEQQSPSAEAPIPHAAEALAGAMPQAILGTGMSTT
jgi:hypothetical protein